MEEKKMFNQLGTMSRLQINARHQEKLMAVLVWLGRYKFSTAFILAVLLRINISNVRALLKQMVQNNLVRTELLPSGYRIYGISADGIGVLDNTYPKRADVARPFQFGKTPVSTFTHQINVQLAELSLSMFGWTDFVAGRELVYFRAAQIPDLACLDPNGLATAVEVELNIKSNQRMKTVCENYSGMIAAQLDPCTCYQRVLYLTPFTKRLEELLDQYVPPKKRCLFEVAPLYPAPLQLTPRRNHDGVGRGYK